MTARTSPRSAHVPTTLYVELTTECNLRCKHCHMWLTTKGPQALTTSEKIRVIREFGAIAPGGGVVFTGGEPFREAEELFALCVVGRDLGLRTLTNTNGTYFDEPTLDRTAAYGPDVVVVSLDSHVEGIHDFGRGIPGTHRAALDAISHLLTLRDSGIKRLPIIYVSAILCELTLFEARELVEFVRSLGADGITFQMLEHTFMLSGNADKFFDQYWFRDPGRAKQALRSLADEYAGDKFVLLSPEDFYWMGIYIDNPAELPVPVCGSHERNIWVDTYGETQMCSYMREITGGRSLGNIRVRSLAEMLASEFAQEVRDTMSTCTRACGMLNCHRKRQ
ncbi:MAG TPA: radical SAM/SPASM domain-containing protein [Bryobacteraceae bacterium]|jgi:MoaA/NifB/PqqE/SkfB family radical SAM enzyme|nr:radical SAM/SPASM domain-containing protein [Bryobacteraceae bacterium]